jgi:riboflavin synthase
MMFTGLIEEVGNVVALRPNESAKRLEVSAPRLAGRVRLGDSVAVNGCCLTATTNQNARLGFDLLQESLDRTNLHALRPDSGVNLELALTAGAPLGGHFVQGHIDCAAAILALEERGADLRLEIELASEFQAYVAGKGSIAVNGISLTIAEVLPASFAVWIIPHTRAQTNLSAARVGDLLNLEFDILAKYVERMLERRPVNRA